MINIGGHEVLLRVAYEKHLFVKDVVEHVWNDVGDSVSDVLEDGSSFLLVGFE